MKYKYRKHRKLIVAAAVVLSASIFVTGTYAWRSISQEALNENLRTVNPGGRLHDDFNGENKDVYAENFMEKSEDGVPIYVRIRLDEYLETGKDAGEKLDDKDRKAKPAVEGTDVNKKETWITYKPNQDSLTLAEDKDRDPFVKYWKWKFGGETIYMPTFNKNKDSLAADINGTWEGKSTTKLHYDDYVTYELDEQKPGNAIYDADEDDEDEKNPVEGEDIETVSEVHIAKKTQSAIVLTMKQWKAQGSPVGNYWVYDSDGWAYWAAPLQPGETTGLLLDGIEKEKNGTLDENCYYAINVVSQFATRDDLQGTNDTDGFYYYKDKTEGTDGTLTGVTEDGLYLLNLISNQGYTVSVQPETNTADTETETITTVKAGEELTFAAAVTCMDKKIDNQNVTWNVIGNRSEDTKIDSHGVLTVSADELGEGSEDAEAAAGKTETVKNENPEAVNGASKDQNVSLLTIRATDVNGNTGEYIVKVVKQ